MMNLSPHLFVVAAMIGCYALLAGFTQQWGLLALYTGLSTLFIVAAVRERAKE